MKVIIDSEEMVLNYEPLEKGQEVEIDHEIGMVWIQSGRAHRPEKAKDEKSLSNEESDSGSEEENLEEEENKDKNTSDKTTPQNTADKKAKEKR